MKQKTKNKKISSKEQQTNVLKSVLIDNKVHSRVKTYCNKNGYHIKAFVEKTLSKAVTKK